MENESNGDEARRKPATILESSVDRENYDILVIGRTGISKSSTVDKLMILNTCFHGAQSTTISSIKSERKDAASSEPGGESHSCELERKDKPSFEPEGANHPS